MSDIIIEPVVVPAKPEKTYSNGWVSQMTITAPHPNREISVTYIINPYDGKDSIIGGKQRTIPKVKSILATYPKLAAAYQAVIEAVTEYEASLLP